MEPEPTAETGPETEQVEEEEKPKRRGLTLAFNPKHEVPKVTSRELIAAILKENPLFKNVFKEDSGLELANILVTGFGLRNLESLQAAIAEKDRIETAKTESQMFPCVCSRDSSEESLLPPPPSISSKFPGLITQEVEYLLHHVQHGESQEDLTEPYSGIPYELRPESEPESKPLSNLELKKKYLKDHKIFELFQFLLAHMLSCAPENPIEYILTLLDKILLYRTGLLSPPLLYEKKHIEQLFHLMDRFGIGYVEMNQYDTAMNTLQICQYNRNPKTNKAGMVSRATFVKEIYDAEITVFNDLVRNRIPCVCLQNLSAPPPSVIDIDLKTNSLSSATGSINQMLPVMSKEKFYAKPGENTDYIQAKHLDELNEDERLEAIEAGKRAEEENLLAALHDEIEKDEEIV